MKTLVVGQDVYVVSNKGFYFRQGKVTEITPEGVEVVCDEPLSMVGYGLDSLHAVPMRFDNEGKNGTDGWDGMNVCGFDWYPWHIDNMPFAERKRICATLKS